MLERDEENAQGTYDTIRHIRPDVKNIIEVVLGLNDALIELTGALAGLTFALQNTRLIALAGLITGIAASFSMAASEYLSTKAERGGSETNPIKSAVYTGIAYILTVVLLVLPYLVFADYLLCLICTIAIAILIIFVSTIMLPWRKISHFASASSTAQLSVLPAPSGTHPSISASTVCGFRVQVIRFSLRGSR